MAENPSKSSYPELSDAALKQIAIDYRAGLIFTDRDVRDKKDLHLVFMPFLLATEEFINDLKKDPPGLVYEYISKAGPRSINGMPMFMSAAMLSIAQTARVKEFIQALQNAEQAVKL